MVAHLTPDQKAACSNHVGVKIFFPQSDCDTFVQKVCLQWGLNSWPLVYKTNALPLSYRGPRCVGDKMQQNCLGDTRIWTMDLSDCSRLLYHWAISPSHATSSTVWVTCVDTGWRNICHEGPLVAFADVQNMPWPGFEPGLLRPQRRVLTTRRSRQSSLGVPTHGIWGRKVTTALVVPEETGVFDPCCYWLQGVFVV